MLSSQSELAATEYNGMPHGSGTSNPTQNKALAYIDREDLAGAIAVVQAVHRILSPKQAIFLQARRDANNMVHDAVGRPGWVQDTQNNYAKAINYRYGYTDIPCEQTVQK